MHFIFHIKVVYNKLQFIGLIGGTHPNLGATNCSLHTIHYRTTRVIIRKRTSIVCGYMPQALLSQVLSTNSSFVSGKLGKKLMPVSSSNLLTEMAFLAISLSGALCL